MTQADLDKILDACQPTPVMKIGNYEGSSPQENANRAWKELGSRMGFDGETAQPAEGGDRFFTAVPSETTEQTETRQKRELAKKRQEDIQNIKDQILNLQRQLDELTKSE